MTAIVFDFDGVLVDSEPVHKAALLQAVGALDMTFTHEQYLGRYVGFDDRDCFRAIAADNNRPFSPELAADLAQRKAAAIGGLIENGAFTPFPGAVELVRAAAVAGPVGLCSGARRHEIEPVLRQLGLSTVFQAVVTADDVAHSKPDPEGYTLVAQLLRVEPRRCIAIEDTPTGIEAALAAGYAAIGVGHTFPVDQLIGAPVRVARIAELTIEAVLGAAQTR
jgi:beta-phosphoglucomutase